MGDPIAKARHQPQGKVRQQVFVTIEIWNKPRPDRVTPSRRLEAYTRKVEQEPSIRSRTETDPTRKGTPSRRPKAKTRSRGPEGAPLRNSRRRAIGEVGGDPRPTDWRGRTTNSTPSAETQQGDQQRHVHGRETSSNAAMARPTGQNQSAPHYGRKQGED